MSSANGNGCVKKRSESMDWPGAFQHNKDLFTCDTWELRQEIIHVVSAFEMIKKRLHRHAGSSEAGGATENIGMGGGDVFHRYFHIIIGEVRLIDFHSNCLRLHTLLQ